MGSARQCAIRIVRRLQDAGFDTYLAGGCVRDMLMGRTPRDYDIATAATPEKVQTLIQRTKPIGKAFGVIQAQAQGHFFEIATFRSDNEYRDGRRPSSVTFTDPRHDAMRRDFTVNGMFFDPVAEVYIDYVGGIPDIASKLIRTVGTPDARFKEDHLRMLRAVRFSQSLDFAIEQGTAASIRTNSSLIKQISAERVQNELFRILTESPLPGRALLLLDKLRLLGNVLPLTAGSHSATQLKKTAGLLNSLAGEPLETLLAALFLRTGAPPGTAVSLSLLARIRQETGAELSALKAARAVTKNVIRTQHVYWSLAARKHPPRDLLPELITPQAKTAIVIRGATSPGHAVSLRKTRSTVQRRLRAKTITGSDLKALGISPGPRMAKLLKEALILQCEGMKRQEILTKLTRS